MAYKVPEDDVNDYEEMGDGLIPGLSGIELDIIKERKKLVPVYEKHPEMDPDSTFHQVLLDELEHD